MLLPIVNTPADYRPLYRNPAVWLPAMRAICQRHRLDPSALKMAPPGTHVVFFVGAEHVIKLFAPLGGRHDRGSAVRFRRAGLQHPR